MEDIGPGMERVIERLSRQIDQLPPESRLPSVRVLMRTLDVSQSAVVAALDRLEARGAIERRPRSGIFTARNPRKRLLVVLGPSLFIGPSEYGEILLQSVLDECGRAPHPPELVFARPFLGSPGEVTLAQRLGPDVHFGLRSGRYGAVAAFGIEDALTDQLESETEIPVVGYATVSSILVRPARLEACRVAVLELAQRGARTIALASAPYLSAREVFLSAVAEAGLVEVPITPSVELASGPENALVRGYDLFRRGLELGRALATPGARVPGGLVSMDDIYTHGLITALTAEGFDLDRLRIVSYSNLGSPRLEPWQDQITRMECDLGTVAAEVFAGAEAALTGTFPRPGWGEVERRFLSRPSYLRVVPLRIIPPAKL